MLRRVEPGESEEQIENFIHNFYMAPSVQTSLRKRHNIAAVGVVKDSMLANNISYPNFSVVIAIQNIVQSSRSAFVYI